MSKLVQIEVVQDILGIYVNTPKFWDMNTCTTLIKARDFLIKQARKEYVATKDIEDEPASEAITKFEFGTKLVGYFHFDGLNFLFPEGHPIYELAARGYADDPRFGEGLIDLFESTRRVRKRKKAKKVAITPMTPREFVIVKKVA
jgi:hypothetical protein